MLLASAPTVWVTWVIARSCAARQKRYFDLVVATRGRPSRQPSSIRLGLDLDEMSVATWDFLPAWRALGANEVDPDLDALRRSAQIATRQYLAVLPAGFVMAIASAVVLRVSPLVPAILAFFAWGALQHVAFRYALYFSRPELDEMRRDWGRLLGMVTVVVGALLLICFTLVGLALFIRG